MKDKLEKLVSGYKEVINNNERDYGKMYAEDLKSAIAESESLRIVIEDLEEIINGATVSEVRECESCGMQNVGLNSNNLCYGCQALKNEKHSKPKR